MHFLLKMGIFQPAMLPEGTHGKYTALPETNIAPENGWLEDEFPFGFPPIFRCYVSFMEGNVITLLSEVVSTHPFLSKHQGSYL